MAQSYSLNERAAEHAFLESHSWEACAAWHLGLTELAAHELLQVLDAKSG